MSDYLKTGSGTAAPNSGILPDVPTTSVLGELMGDTDGITSQLESIRKFVDEKSKTVLARAHDIDLMKNEIGVALAKARELVCELEVQLESLPDVTRKGIEDGNQYPSGV